MNRFAQLPSLRSAGNFCLGFWLLLAGTAAADHEKTFDLFAFRKAAEAPQAWKAGNGAPTVVYEPESPSGVRFPDLFGANTDRVYWDRAVSLDLRGYDLLELDLTCNQPNAIRMFGLYLKSGEGWYLWRTALKESGRQTLFFPLKDAAVEGRVRGWGKISAIRLSLNREERGLPTEAPGAKAGAWTPLRLPSPERFAQAGQGYGGQGVERKGAEKTATVVAHGLKAHACDLVIVQGTVSITNVGERAFARSRSKLLSRWLQDQGLIHSVVDDEAVAAGGLKPAKVAILPYNSWPPAKELRALESFVKRGGKLMVFYSAEPKLAELMGLKLGSYQTTKVAGQWSSFAFNKHAPPYVPKVVCQDSFNILPAYPADKASRVIAFWQNVAGEDLSDPAWVRSRGGLWMSHVLLDSDAANKQRMLLALLSVYLPELWQQAAARAMTRAGKVGPFTSLAEASAGITGMARGTATADPGSAKGFPGFAGGYAEARAVDALLAQCGQDYKTMITALAKRKYPEVVETGQRLQTTLLEAFARVQRPKNPEFRGVWDHTGMGLYPGNWPKTVRILAEAGLNAVFVNVLWTGRAHYESKVVPQSEAVSRYGDQLKQCLAAARANRLEVHVWKICWNLSNAPESFVAAMRKAGRLQVSSAGEELEWLCPTHPDNVALELKAINEVLTGYAVDGIHLDYARYPDANACFCAGCRRRFERELGAIPTSKGVGTDWPKGVQRGELRERYNAWRSDQITAFVRAVRDVVKKAVPISKGVGTTSKRVRISAAVYPEYPGCVSSLGQDWGRWLKEDLVDFVCPMDYTVNNGAFKNLVRRQLALANAGGPARHSPRLGVASGGAWVGDGGRVFPGLGVTALESQLTPDQVIEQIRQTRAAGAGGFVLFDLNRTLEHDVLPVLSLGITRTDR